MLVPGLFLHQWKVMIFQQVSLNFSDFSSKVTSLPHAMCHSEAHLECWLSAIGVLLIELP